MLPKKKTADQSSLSYLYDVRKPVQNLIEDFKYD